MTSSPPTVFRHILPMVELIPSSKYHPPILLFRRQRTVCSSLEDRGAIRPKKLGVGHITRRDVL